MADLVGMDAPFAMFINYENNGFGKFIIDPKSIDGFEQKLHLIEDSLARKHIYQTINDMLVKNDITGIKALKIIKNNMGSETSPEVISNLLGQVVPTIIKEHIPLKVYEQTYHEIFEIILDQILIKDLQNATQHMVVEYLLGNARNEDHFQLVVKWFQDGFISNTKGEKLENVTVSLKHKHTMMERIWSSKDIDLKTKEELFEKLKE